MATGWHMVLGSLPLVALSAVQEGSSLAERLTQLTGASLCTKLCINFQVEIRPANLQSSSANRRADRAPKSGMHVAAQLENGRC